MVKGHSDSERGNLLLPHGTGLLFLISRSGQVGLGQVRSGQSV